MDEISAAKAATKMVRAKNGVIVMDACASKLSRGAEKLLELLKRLAKRTGLVWASTRRLAEMMEKSIRSIQVYLKELRSLRCISPTPEGYTIAPEPDLPLFQQCRPETAPESAPQSAESAPQSAESAPEKEERPYKSDCINEIPVTAGETINFEQSPERLAQEWCFHSRCPSPSQRDPYSATGFFRELIRLGTSPEIIREEIHNQARDRTEPLFEFGARLKKGRIDFSGIAEWMAKGKAQ